MWSMDRFNQYVNDTFAEEKGLEKDWVLNYVEVNSIMVCFLCLCRLFKKKETGHHSQIIFGP